MVVSIDAGDFYPRPPRGGRRKRIMATYYPINISIHALREEGDASCKIVDKDGNISIHALREEGDFVA